MRSLVLVVVLAGGCGGEGPTESGVGGGGGAPPDTGCAPGEIADEGGACVPAGVPPDACAPGFVADGQGGCTALVPATPCASGMMALPGETRCREIMACGAAPWGDIVVGASTQYVDDSFTGSSDGSASAPWTTIQLGIDNAGPGAIVAVAEGTYTESLVLAGKKVELRGRCPSLVKVVAPGNVIEVFGGSDGSIVSGLALSGGALGVGAFIGRSLRFERIWVVDTALDGIQVGASIGGAEAAVVDSLLERTAQTGALIVGSQLTLERSVVRDTQQVGGDFGRGAVALPDSRARRSQLVVAASWFEGTSEIAIDVAGSDADIDATLVRATRPGAIHGDGHGIQVRVEEVAGELGSAMVTRSVVEASTAAGVHVQGSVAAFDALVVRDTAPRRSDGTFGRGVAAERDPETGATATLSLERSLVERNHEVGVLVAGSVGNLRGVIVRDTATQLHTDLLGYGVSAIDLGVRAKLTLMGCVVDKNHGLGVHLSGADATIEQTRISETLPQGPEKGLSRGIHAQETEESQARSFVTMRESRVQHSLEMGIGIVDSDAVIESSAVIDTAPTPAGLYGDGILVWAWQSAAGLTATDVHVARAARAGVVTFGGSVTIGGSTLECNAIDLVAQDWMQSVHVLNDQGGNQCGCGTTVPCKAQAPNLTPPSAIVE